MYVIALMQNKATAYSYLSWFSPSLHLHLQHDWIGSGPQASHEGINANLQLRLFYMEKKTLI